MKQPKRRLFIDPASISTGWALFEDGDLVDSGTIAVDKKMAVFARLWEIFWQYKNLAVEADEVHIEQLVRNTHIFTHWSVGVIGVALSHVCGGSSIYADIPITSWQRHCDWQGDKGSLSRYKRRAKSEDELAAIGMGLYYISKYGD